MLLQVLAENMQKKGIWYGRQHFSQIRVQMTDKTVEEEEILIRMNSPICAYQTDSLTGRTYFCHPEDDTFEELINVNFRHKYEACYGVKPAGEIGIIPVHLGSRDKYVTKYKNFYITAWKGDYLLVGERKYLDFLYQTGVGSKNSQGFGMFDIKRTEGEGDAERRR
jgi:CRISPR-associated endoribonuclease Cas6